MKETTLEIPSGLFRNKNTTRNDRYVVYRMLNRMVTFKDPVHGQKVEGYVDEVYRDIFASEIRLMIEGKGYRFKDPVVIRANEKMILFLYGDIRKKEVTDDQIFDEMRKEQFRETVSDTLNRLAPQRLVEIEFLLGTKRPSRKKHFLMRGIQALEEMSE